MASSPETACREMAERITVYLEGALAPIDRERCEAHYRACPGCRAALAEMQALVGSLGRLGGARKGTTDPETQRLLGLFREHGLHRPGPRTRRVALGLEGGTVALGDHLAYFWESEQEFMASAGFVAAGVGQGETCILVGHDDANARIEEGLAHAGLDVAGLGRHGRLQRVSGGSSGDALLGEIGDRIKAAIDRGEPWVRILGNLGWGRPDWPTDRELLRLEAAVTEAVRNLPTIVMCAYDVRGVPARNLLLGGLECHPVTLRRGALRPNEHYVPAGAFLAALPPEVT